MVHFNQPREARVHIKTAVIEKPELLTRFEAGV